MSDTGIVALIKALAPKADPAVIEAKVQDWLDAHPEATTTVQDGSITEQKLATSIAQKLGLISSLSDEIDTLDSDVTNLKSAITDNQQTFFDFAGGIAPSVKIANNFVNGRRYLSGGFANVSGYAVSRFAYPAGKYAVKAISPGWVAFAYVSDTQGSAIVGNWTAADYTFTADDPFYITFNAVLSDDIFNSIVANFDIRRIVNESGNSIKDDVDALDDRITTVEGQIGEVENAADELSDKVDEIVIDDVSENIFDGIFVLGEQVATSSGAFVDGSSYARTDYIPIKAGPVHIGVQTLSSPSTVFVHCALYDAEHNKLSAFPYTGITVNNASDLYYQTVTATQDGYIAFDIYKQNAGHANYYVSQVAVPVGYVAYHDPQKYINPDLLPDIASNVITESMTYGKTPSQAKKDSFASGEVMVVETNSILKNQEITFFAKIGTFGALYIGHGQTDYGYYVKIDDTNITYMSNGNSGTAVPHGLTIESYISVIIKVNNIGTMTVIVNTLNGSKTDTRGTWLGRKGEVFAKSENSTLTEAILTWNSNDYKKAIWAFGDSYFSNNAGTRWTYWLVSPWGFDTMLLNSYPGEASANAYNDLITALTHGTPKYLLWCLGMNDHDTNSTVNSDWLEKVEAIETLCQERGITLILATIPNVTNAAYNNTYKNQYVVESGYRYVDFAGAVDGVSGWLSDDGVHPNEAGARIFASKAIADCPELIQES